MLPGKPDSVEADPRIVTDQKKENVKNMMERGKEMEKRRIKERGKKLEGRKKRGEQSQTVSWVSGVFFLCTPVSWLDSRRMV